MGWILNLASIHAHYRNHSNCLKDELYADGGTGLRVIFAVDGDVSRIASYHFFERTTEKPMDFELEDDEKEIVLEFCKSHLEG